MGARATAAVEASRLRAPRSALLAAQAGVAKCAPIPAADGVRFTSTRPVRPQEPAGVERCCGTRPCWAEGALAALSEGYMRDARSDSYGTAMQGGRQPSGEVVSAWGAVPQGTRRCMSQQRRAPGPCMHTRQKLKHTQAAGVETLGRPPDAQQRGVPAAAAWGARTQSRGRACWPRRRRAGLRTAARPRPPAPPPPRPRRRPPAARASQRAPRCRPPSRGACRRAAAARR